MCVFGEMMVSGGGRGERPFDTEIVSFRGAGDFEPLGPLPEEWLPVCWAFGCKERVRVHVPAAHRHEPTGVITLVSKPRQRRV